MPLAGLIAGAGAVTGISGKIGSALGSLGGIFGGGGSTDAGRETRVKIKQLYLSGRFAEAQKLWDSMPRNWRFVRDGWTLKTHIAKYGKSALQPYLQWKQGRSSAPVSSSEIRSSYSNSQQAGAGAQSGGNIVKYLIAAGAVFGLFKLLNKK